VKLVKIILVSCEPRRDTTTKNWKSRDANPQQNRAGSVCGFQKFVTSGSGLGFGFLKIQFCFWVQAQGSKVFKKIGFWVEIRVGFCTLTLWMFTKSNLASSSRNWKNIWVLGRARLGLHL
jgi:hypothetical protein